MSLINKPKSKKEAFTVIELILVIALIGLLSAVTVPFFQSMQISTQRNTLANEIIANLHRAKLKAVAASDDQSWGINFEDQIIIFRGADFPGRDKSYDEILEIPKTITVEGSLNQIIFNKFTGLPNSAGTVVIRDSNGQSQTINVSIQGTVDY